MITGAMANNIINEYIAEGGFSGRVLVVPALLIFTPQSIFLAVAPEF
jgi:hypothetical protein